MSNFWDYSIWGSVNLIAVLLLSLLAANVLKRTVPFLEKSLIPTSVFGGLILLVISAIYKAITGDVMFNTNFFAGQGITTLEVVTYHSLALGFIASSFKTANGKLTKKRTVEIFNTGVTTVSTYLIQAIVGLAITMIATLFITDFFSAAGVLLPFGYGQGTGQALNYGNIYETEYGFDGGKSFGLTIAALGFISASLGGVVHLNILKRRRGFSFEEHHEGALSSEDIQGKNEIPMQGSVDKLTVQVALIVGTYLLTNMALMLLGNLLSGMRAVIYGFNFLLGVLLATLIKICINKLRAKNVIKKDYINEFLMTRTSNFFFDIMVVAGIAAIRLDILERYWGIMLMLGIVGLFITYFYNHLVAKKLFPEYTEQQFLMMYGMLTGTASTGIILLREIDGSFKTPAADNMVYQNFPAIVFGFPMMLLATLAPTEPLLTLIILIVFFLAMNILLFRSFIFKRRKK